MIGVLRHPVREALEHLVKRTVFCHVFGFRARGARIEFLNLHVLCGEIIFGLEGLEFRVEEEVGELGEWGGPGFGGTKKEGFGSGGRGEVEREGFGEGF